MSPFGGIEFFQELVERVLVGGGLPEVVGEEGALLGELLLALGERVEAGRAALEVGAAVLELAADFALQFEGVVAVIFGFDLGGFLRGLALFLFEALFLALGVGDVGGLGGRGLGELGALGLVTLDLEEVRFLGLLGGQALFGITPVDGAKDEYADEGNDEVGFVHDSRGLSLETMKVGKS